MTEHVLYVSKESVATNCGQAMMPARNQLQLGDDHGRYLQVVYPAYTLADRHLHEERSMTRKTSGLTLIILGIILFIISLIADQLGLGTKPGLGWKQWMGIGISVFLFLTGIWLARLARQIE